MLANNLGETFEGMLLVHSIYGGDDECMSLFLDSEVIWNPLKQLQLHIIEVCVYCVVLAHIVV